MATAAVAVALGVASHVFWFRHGEHHMLVPRYLQTLIGATVGGVVALTKFGKQSVAGAIGDVVLLIASYLIGVLSSLTLYRLCFAPITKFPGPTPSMHTSLLGGQYTYMI
jgi:hypothetical protein